MWAECKSKSMQRAWTSMRERMWDVVKLTHTVACRWRGEEGTAHRHERRKWSVLAHQKIVSRCQDPESTLNEKREAQWDICGVKRQFSILIAVCHNFVFSRIQKNTVVRKQTSNAPQQLLRQHTRHVAILPRPEEGWATRWVRSCSLALYYSIMALYYSMWDRDRFHGNYCAGVYSS